MKMFFTLNVILLLGIVSYTQALCTFDNADCSILCEYIESGHPGHEAAEIAVDNFDNCNLSSQTFSLVFRSCVFPKATLDMNWFNPQTPGPMKTFSKLLFQNNVLYTFEDGALAASDSFKNSLQSLRIEEYRGFSVDASGLFEGLTNLSSFEMYVSKYDFEVEVLSPVASTLKKLVLYGRTPQNTQTIANVTGICQKSNFPLLDYISFTALDSEIPVLSNKMFTGIDDTKDREILLYLDDNQIKYIEDNEALNAFGGKLTLLSLDTNLLSTIPDGLFDKAIAEGIYHLGVFLDENPWHCDCHLQYLQDVMKTESSHVVQVLDNPKCVSPSSQAGKLIIEADMSTECEPLPPVPPVQISC